MTKTALAVLACLAATAAAVAAELPVPRFAKLILSDQFHCEGEYFGDFNRDGRMDAVAGPFWFEGPAFQTRHEIRAPKTFDPNGYSDNFLTYTGNINGDGVPDVLVGNKKGIFLHLGGTVPFSRASPPKLGQFP